MRNRVVANELIPIYESESGSRYVDARKLHEYLLVGRDFSTWIKSKLTKYGFIEGEDFSPVWVKTSNSGRPTIDYMLEIDTAKEIAMLENNDRGREIRRYFIKVEKELKKAQLLPEDPSLKMAKYLLDALTKKEQEDKRRDIEIEKMQTKVTVIQSTFLEQKDEDWRKSINKMLNDAIRRSDGDHRQMRRTSYLKLEERARCNLNIRLTNLKDRLEEGGATATKVKEANKLSVIESDARLKEIYTTIVKELSIGSLV